MERIDLYLQWQLGETYENTAEENALVQKVSALFAIAESIQKSNEHANPRKIAQQRKAYQGILNALDSKTGLESDRKSKQLYKPIYELIEAKIDNNVPMPKMSPRHKDDIVLCQRTEDYLKFEMDRMLSLQENDRCERATYTDGTSWFKIGWDSLDSTHNRSGDLRVEVLLIDQVIPEPGVRNYKLMNYIFERQKIQLSRLYDIYGRIISPAETGQNTAEVITFYYKNKNGIIGRLMYSYNSRQVIVHEEDWQIRKIRKCTKCATVNPIQEECKNCGNKTFKYENATEEILAEDIKYMYNPYEAGESDNPDDTIKEVVFLEKDTRIPFYRVRQLPFIPRPSVSSLDSIYGVSEVGLLVDIQDSINKILTKTEDKQLKSGVIVTHHERSKINNTDDTFKMMGVKTAEEANMIQVKQVLADVNQDLALQSVLYQSMRNITGITESYQGKKDTTATSGKAKELMAVQSAGRLESLRIMKGAAYAGVYELMFKYLLAFSDETRKFVKILPDGKKQETMWNKYMFLDKDTFGKVYYKDDFAFSTDPAATLGNNRNQMWQETMSQFLQGTFGDPSDPRIRKMFWNILDQHQYPLAKVAIAGIEETEQHLPQELEAAILQNPQILQMASALVAEQQKGSGQGGARPNSGPEGNGFTQAANIERTNERNRVASGNPMQVKGV